MHGVTTKITELSLKNSVLVLLSVTVHSCHGYSYISFFLITSCDISHFSAINIANYISPLRSYIDVESPLPDTVRYRPIGVDNMPTPHLWTEPNWRLPSYNTAFTVKWCRISRTERSSLVSLILPKLHQRYQILENVILSSINDRNLPIFTLYIFRAVGNSMECSFMEYAHTIYM